jgi:ATP/maltotriose-dependent transcriptional regulator MalT
VLQGRLKQAAATYGEVVQLVKRPEELRLLIASPAYYFGLGDLLREWNELEAAEQHLVRGMDLIKGMLAIDVDKLWLGYTALARLQQAQGKDDQALATPDAFMQPAQATCRSAAPGPGCCLAGTTGAGPGRSASRLLLGR